MKTVVLIAFILLIIPTLSGQGGNKSNFAVLNFEKSFSRQQEVPLSRFVDKITYIPLETNSQALFGAAYYEVTDEYIIVRQASRERRILLFDRHTGKFIREIGKFGRGPGEYFDYSLIPFNPGKKELYAMSGSREILVYDLEGRNIDKIKIPEIKDKYGEVLQLSKKPIVFDNTLENNIFVGYFRNSFGQEKNKLVLITKEGVSKMFPNYQVQDLKIKDGLILINRLNASFYTWDNKLYFLETFCDTLFQVTKSSLVPRYCFDWGKYNVTWSKIADLGISGLLNYFFIYDIDENKDYIFIKIEIERKHYLGFIEKKTNIVTFCKKNNWDDSRLKDDISGIIDVLPADFTQKNEMIFIIEPGYLMQWLKANPEKAAIARTKFSWLKDIDEFSNPIIAIGKCKE